MGADIYRFSHYNDENASDHYFRDSYNRYNIFWSLGIHYGEVIPELERKYGTESYDEDKPNLPFEAVVDLHNLLSICSVKIPPSSWMFNEDDWNELPHHAQVDWASYAFERFHELLEFLEDTIEMGDGLIVSY